MVKGNSKVTLADVAKSAGVSRASASRILNRRAGFSFSEATASKVREAAETLGYAPAPRRGGALLDGRCILIVCPNIGNPYYAGLAQAIQQAAALHNFSTLLATTYREACAEERLFASATTSGAAGTIFTMMPQCAPLVERWRKTMPVVVIGDREASLNVDTVELDNYGAGALVAQHLTELGHEHLAYISTSLNAATPPRTRRLQGLTDTCRELCPQGTVLVRSRDVSPQEELDDMDVERRTGRDLTRQCLAEENLTAFVAVNDMVGYGVLEAGFHVPRDYSVCGFGNIFPSGLAALTLTSVDHHIQAKGHNAVAMLCRCMADAQATPNITRVEYKPRLIIRSSTAPPRRESARNNA